MESLHVSQAISEKQDGANISRLLPLGSHSETLKKASAEIGHGASMDFSYDLLGLLLVLVGQMADGQVGGNVRVIRHNPQPVSVVQLVNHKA